MASKQCNSSSYIFHEAISHCRWKTVLKKFLKTINIKDYQHHSFEEIMISIYEKCKDIKGIGMLTVYDITAGICRHYHLKIEKVYIVGNGPKRAIQILKLKPKVQKIGKTRLRYVNMGDILVSLDKCKANINPKIRKSMDGDAMESYLCNWQKTIKK